MVENRRFHDGPVVRIRLDELSLQHPRQWGSCWLVLELYRPPGLDNFFAARLPASRKGTRWEQTLQVLVTRRLLAPGPEWDLYRDWFRSRSFTKDELRNRTQERPELGLQWSLKPG